MKKLIIVCGPTATGKSDYAVALAKKVGGEIISADSRQVYCGLDIGSGKITESEMDGIPHHLLDVEIPQNVFSASDYRKLAMKAIDEIIERGNQPIICGGTGFYIDTIICGAVFPEVPPNKDLRLFLGNLSVEELAEQLLKSDPKRYELIDKKNKVRLIRALEIVEALGFVPPLERQQEFEIDWHYLDFSDEVLKKRIHDRLYKRVEMGMIEEVEKLNKNGLSFERLESLGLEYRYIALYLQNKITKEEMLKDLEAAIWQYAKRQRTWFKKYAK